MISNISISSILLDGVLFRLLEALKTAYSWHFFYYLKTITTYEESNATSSGDLKSRTWKDGFETPIELPFFFFYIVVSLLKGRP